jgi:acyl dehydratase
MDTVLPHVSLSFSSPPSLGVAYARALLSLRPTLAPAGHAQPLIEASLAGLTAAPERLAAYREICGFPVGHGLPLTYPHVMAMPLHMAILTASAFPVRLLGLVHVGNRITRGLQTGAEDALDMRCTLNAMRETARGQEFDLVTEASCEGERAWAGTSTFLARRAAPRPDPMTSSAASLPVGMRTTLLPVPADIGRRYARVSGDINPIHLSSLTARLFGFPQAIAHGMWSLARTAAAIEAQEDRPLASISATFKLPVLLPAQVQLHTWDENAGCAYGLTDETGARPHMNGAARFA